MTEPELSLEEFFAALSAETEKSPKIVPEHIAAQQSREARRQRRDAIIADRGRLYSASKALVAGEVVKSRAPIQAMQRLSFHPSPSLSFHTLSSIRQYSPPDDVDAAVAAPAERNVLRSARL